jgi:AraC-like DNA-binding protein
MSDRRIVAPLPQNQLSTTDRVREALTELLPSGRCSIDEISKAFQIDRRSVARKLKSEGTTYSALLNSVRWSLLRSQIQTEKLSLTELAPLLGFSSLSALSRWRSKGREKSSLGDMKKIEPGFWMNDTHYAFYIEIPAPRRRPISRPKRSNRDHN